LAAASIRTRRRFLSMVRLTAISLAALLLAPAAASASGADVIKDCARNGQLTKKYSQAEYDQALADLPADIEEYGDCRNIIRAAQLGAAGGGSGGGPAGSIPGVGAAAATPHTPAEKHAIQQATSKGDAPVKLSSAGKPLVPGASSVSAGGLGHGLPAPIVIALVLLGVAALAGAVIALRPQIQRVLARRRG
jgi:HAMP domain-containing protein